MFAKKTRIAVCVVGISGMLGAGTAFADALSQAVKYVERARAAIGDFENAKHEVDDLTRQIVGTQAKYEEAVAQYRRTGAREWQREVERLERIITSLEQKRDTAVVRTESLRQKAVSLLMGAQEEVSGQMRVLYSQQAKEQSTFERLQSLFEKTGDARVAVLMRQSQARLAEIEAQISEAAKLLDWVQGKIAELTRGLSG